jgi:gentisate 1,2-dioxygenase
MQSLSDNINTNENLWNEQEIKDLILYAKQLEADNEDLRAKMVMMNTALNREEKKVNRLNNIINYITNGEGTNT